MADSVVFIDGSRKKAKPRTVSLVREDNVHRVVVSHLHLRAAPGVVFWHTPNGGKRQIAEAARFKKLGVLPGIPDLLLLHAGQLYALELKTEVGRLSDDQTVALVALREAGAITGVAYGLDHALELLKSWGIFDR